MVFVGFIDPGDRGGPFRRGARRFENWTPMSVPAGVVLAILGLALGRLSFRVLRKSVATGLRAERMAPVLVPMFAFLRWGMLGVAAVVVARAFGPVGAFVLMISVTFSLLASAVLQARAQSTS